VQLALADDAVDLTEYGTLATAAATLVATVWAVWRVPNKPVASYTRADARRDDAAGY
jgi:hypothetical protein